MANTMITLEKILNDSMWVVKYSGWRQSCRYSEIDHDNEDIRDIDLAAKQPKHLEPFFNAYEEYSRAHGWITIQDFYKVWELQPEQQTTKVAHNCQNCPLKDCDYNGERCSILS